MSAADEHIHCRCTIDSIAKKACEMVKEKIDVSRVAAGLDPKNFTQ